MKINVVVVSLSAFEISLHLNGKSKIFQNVAYHIAFGNGDALVAPHAVLSSYRRHTYECTYKYTSYVHECNVLNNVLNAQFAANTVCDIRPLWCDMSW